MSNFRFKRLEKYKVGGIRNNMELNIPLPKTPSGKVYRWCPEELCIPRLFLLGESHPQKDFDSTKSRRAPGSKGTTCPYCGKDADDDNFNYEGDIEVIKKYIKWAVMRDMNDNLGKWAKDLNRSMPKGGLISLQMDVKPDHTPQPRAWREDLIRNLSCDICGREYGVYAIGLFCPDCGSKNLKVHFEREIELILQQIDLAESVSESGNNELSYRVLGNAHEDVVTAFETYQKTFYKYKVRQIFSSEEAEKLLGKKAIGNGFQNIDRSEKLYRTLSLDPFSVMSSQEMDLLRFNIEKRHVIGHNLSISDEAYAGSEDREKPGTTVEILADETAEFSEIAKKLIVELERLM
jgi:hypothetical protein